MEGCCDSEDDVSDCAEYHMESIRRFHMMNQKEFDVYTVARLGNVCPERPWNPPTISKCSSGKCVAVVRFRCNRPISIVSYGFFGPMEPACFGKYHMEIQLLTWDYRQIAKADSLTPVQRGPNIFHVKFDLPVPILPCTWYCAKFSLMGPPTAQSRKISTSKVLKCGDYETVTFKFDEPDSNQLPEISFILRY